MSRPRTQMARDTLTPKQEAFAQHYAIHGNASEAYRTAYGAVGKNENTISVGGAKLLKLGKVMVRIAELSQRKQAVLEEKFDVTVEQIGRELMALGFYDVRDFYTWGTQTVIKTKGKGENVTEVEVEEPYVRLKTSDELTPRQAKAVVGVEMSVSRTGERLVTMKLADKRAALVDLGKHLGFFEKDNAQRATNIYIVEDDAV